MRKQTGLLAATAWRVGFYSPEQGGVRRWETTERKQQGLEGFLAKLTRQVSCPRQAGGQNKQ